MLIESVKRPLPETFEFSSYGNSIVLIRNKGIVLSSIKLTRVNVINRSIVLFECLMKLLSNLKQKNGK